MPILEKFNTKEFKEYAIKDTVIDGHGVIFRTISGFYGMVDSSKGKYETVYIKKGDLIQFRYQHSAHCRNMDNIYFMIDTVVLAFKCVPFARIHEDVCFGNKHNLKEIVENQLCDLFENE